MRKIISLLFITMLSMVAIYGNMSIAAVKKSVDETKYGIGILQIPVNNFTASVFGQIPIVYPTFKSKMGNYSGEVGINISSANSSALGTSNSHFGVVSKNEYILTKGSLSTHAGAILAYDSFSNISLLAGGLSGTIFAVGGYYGITFNPKEDFDISIDLLPIFYSSLSSGGMSIPYMQIGVGSISAHYYF